MAEVLVWHDDHGDWHYGPINSTKDLHEAALKILTERLDNDYIFWPEDHLPRAEKILTENDGAAAYQLLQERKDHEYEGISLNKLR